MLINKIRIALTNENYPSTKNNSGYRRTHNILYFHLFFKYIRSNIRFLNGITYPSPKSFLKISKKSLQFFSEYADHSGKIVAIIKDGFGKNSDFFGSITGFSITKPMEPEISFLEIAKRHLMSGYTDLWNLRLN